MAYPRTFYGASISVHPAAIDADEPASNLVLRASLRIALDAWVSAKPWWSRWWWRRQQGELFEMVWGWSQGARGE